MASVPNLKQKQKDVNMMHFVVPYFIITLYMQINYYEYNFNKVHFMSGITLLMYLRIRFLQYQCWL